MPNSTALRPARDLTQEVSDVPRVGHATGRAFEGLTLLAHADQKQARAAADAGRILVAAGPTSDAIGMALPFASAPPDKVAAILSLYGYAASAGSEATGRIWALLLSFRNQGALN